MPPTPRYRALTWDHPRGYDALAAAAKARRDIDGIDIQWEKQPLEGFESHPIEDLCERFDLVVLDHPHVGEAVARRCLQSIDSHFEDSDLAQWQANSIGPSLRSYRIAGKTWALPLDAAAQVTAYRRDLLGTPPATWDALVALPPSVRVALSLAGPHAILTFMSLAATLGEPIGSAADGGFVAESTGKRVLEVMRPLYRRTDPRTMSLNPIGLLDLMRSSDELALIPLVFGYVNYSTHASAGTHVVSFCDVPTFSGSPADAHSVIGGTGIAISARCQVTPELLSHLRWLLSEDAQTTFIPRHAGQPSRRSAWRDEHVNEMTGGFFAHTARTLEQSWVRPRHDGYIAFQSRASAMLRDTLESARSDASLLNDLDALYRNSFTSHTQDAE
ncbi:MULTISPECIES: hypothetical protein [unclassified Caballeronia]|uniref:hypothetical protein n=1 Tax=unclassified Caballeronia TaxID=2646786 RepID=UPI0028653318|nr:MULTISPECIES: hypothetical protein [unclassified Caballeronia]MDR5741044.1 extracellular solute-binding protein [Caballeronia sp. LZ016]MDR5806942.1 extracellular solute-binding protein [Caballeronia sp. LZ019]